MKQVADLHFVSFDVLFSPKKTAFVRYTAEGMHGGEPHNGIEPTGKKATWTATATFRAENGKLAEFIKD
jgi:hypothetical protein